MPTFQFAPTPNPNSLKITSDAGPFIASGMAVFASPAEAAGHPLGEPLFGVEGVHNVFILPGFLTVTKRPDADWSSVRPAVERILTAHFGT